MHLIISYKVLNLYFNLQRHGKGEGRGGGGKGGGGAPPTRGTVQMGRGAGNPLDGPLSPIQDVSPSLEAEEQESMRYSQVMTTSFPAHVAGEERLICFRRWNS
jgi:hypothetical protein